MELVLTIIELAVLIIIFGAEAVLVWDIKFKGSMPSRITHLILAALICVLEISSIILRVSSGRTYVSNICLVVIWAFATFMDVRNIKMKKEEECENNQ